MPFGELNEGFASQPFGLAWQLQDSDSESFPLQGRFEAMGAAAELSVGPTHCAAAFKVSSSALEELTEGVHDLLRTDFRLVEGAAEQSFPEALEAYHDRATIPSVRLEWMLAHVFYDAADPRRGILKPPEPVALRPMLLRELRDRMLRHPGRVVGFAGDIDRAQAEAAAAAFLPPVDRDVGGQARIAALPLVPQAQREPRPRTYLDQVSQVHLAVAAEGRVCTGLDAVVASLADAILRDRLYHAIRSRAGAAYGVSTTGIAAPWPVIHSIRTATRADRRDMVVDITLATLGELGTKGPTEVEVARAGLTLQNALASATRSPMRVLERAVDNELWPSHDDGQGNLVEHLAAVDPAAVGAVCAELFRPERFTTCLLYTSPSPRD